MKHHWVYLITNLVNGKIYVGRHSGKNLQAYLRHGYMHALTGHNGRTYLANALLCYGEESFTIEPLVEVPSYLELPLIEQQLNAIETFFIRVLDSRNSEVGYNITAGGDGRVGVRRPMSEQHKRKIGDATRGRKCTWAHKISAAQKGAKRSQEWKDALRGSHGGPHTKERSAEHRAKITEHKKKFWATASPERKAEIAARIKEGQRKARELKTNGAATA